MTICDECGKVLTTKNGKRIHSANFDSRFKYKRKSDFNAGIIYAHCDGCYEKLTEPTPNHLRGVNAARFRLLSDVKATAEPIVAHNKV